MANFRGTNIPDNTLDAMRAEDPGKYDRILEQLANAIDNNDSRDANDAIMKIAHFSMQAYKDPNDRSKGLSEEYGRGHGNPNVSNIHSSKWRVTASEVDPYLPWAAEHVNSSNSSYMLYNGQLVTYDDMKGAAIDGKIINSWGQRGHTEAGGKIGKDNPYEGDDAAAPTNPIHVGEPGGEDKVRELWPKVDWDGGGANSGNMEQYDWWESKGLLNEKGWIGEGGFEWPQVDPQILSPGDFGFSKETPEAGYSYPQYNYLNKAGIGHNLAYAPGSRSAWMQRETAADRKDILAKGGTPTYYTGMEGGGAKLDYAGYVDKYPGLLTAYTDNSRGLTKSAWGKQHYEKHGVNEGRTPETTYPLRDLMYYYGGKAPMNVPGGWTPQTPPGRPASEVLDFPKGEARQPVYPIARTPLYPSGLLSPEGALPEAPVVPPVKPPNGGPPGGTVDSYGGLLADYKNMMGLARGTSNSDSFWRVTGDPYKVTGKFGGTGPDKAYGSYRIPITAYGANYDPTETYATRRSSVEGWQPGMNLWSTPVFEAGGGQINMGDISFADWAGTKGAYTSTPYTTETRGQGIRHPVFGGLLASPGDHRAQDPGSGIWTENIPWLHGEAEGAAYPWLTSSQPSVFGTDLYKDAGWGFQPIYGVESRGGDEVLSENILGFDLPTTRSSWD
jgi:hypothetical protein